MQSGWRIGTVFGIPLLIHPSWLAIVLLVTFANALDWGLAYPQWSGGLTWVLGLVSALLLFTSVLLHELGHSLVARAQGIQVNSITLFLFGGIASIARDSKTPGQAFQVAIAGPLVSLGLFGLLTLGTQWSGIQSPLGVLTEDLAHINLIVALFNLIPGLPLDGGQVLRAAVWKLTGDRFRAVHWAARSGLILGSGAILAGLVLCFLLGDWSGLWISLLGWFGVQNARQYNNLTTLQEALTQLTGAEAMTREFRVLEGSLSVRQFAEDYVLREIEPDAAKPSVYFVASDGRYRGQITLTDLQRLERGTWESTSLEAIAHPLESIPHVKETTALITVINRLEQDSLDRITVLSPAGAVAGVIDRGDIVRAVAAKLNLKLDSAAIAQIKREGKYPLGLQLGAIAQATAEAEP